MSKDAFDTTLVSDKDIYRRLGISGMIVEAGNMILKSLHSTQDFPVYRYVDYSGCPIPVEYVEDPEFGDLLDPSGSVRYSKVAVTDPSHLRELNNLAQRIRNKFDRDRWDVALLDTLRLKYPGLWGRTDSIRIDSRNNILILHFKNDTVDKVELGCPDSLSKHGLSDLTGWLQPFIEGASNDDLTDTTNTLPDQMKSALCDDHPPKTLVLSRIHPLTIKLEVTLDKVKSMLTYHYDDIDNVIRDIYLDVRSNTFVVLYHSGKYLVIQVDPKLDVDYLVGEIIESIRAQSTGAIK